MGWVKDKETAFKNINKNLKPEGIVFKAGGNSEGKTLMGTETVQLIEDKLVFAPCEIYEKNGASCEFSLQLKKKHPTVSKYKNIENFTYI